VEKGDKDLALLDERNVKVKKSEQKREKKKQDKRARELQPEKMDKKEQSKKAKADTLLAELESVCARLREGGTLSADEIKSIRRSLNSHGKGDIAYLTKKLNHAETFIAGEVVALVLDSGGGGLRATKLPPAGLTIFAWSIVANDTDDSTKPQPNLISNPSRLDEKSSVLVVYMGHVHVLVDGNVKAGDILVASGKGDGLAISASRAENNSRRNQVGVALSDFIAGEEQGVIALVWLSENKVVEDGELASLPDHVKSLSVRLDEYKERIKVDAIAITMRLNDLDSRVGRLETFFPDALKIKAALDDFVEGALLREYNSMCVRLFCRPSVKITMDVAESIVNDSVCLEICFALLSRNRCIFLEGAAGVGKTVLLKSLCFKQHIQKNLQLLQPWDIFIYVDLAGVSSLESLERLAANCFRLKDTVEIDLVAKALERYKDRIVYLFDSYDEVEGTSWITSLRENRVSWIDRFVIATRANNHRYNDLAFKDAMTIHMGIGIENEAKRNLMIGLSLTGDGRDNLLQLLGSNPELNLLSFNPLMCEMICYGFERSDHKEKFLGVTSLFDAMFEQLSYRASDKNQAGLALACRNLEFSEAALLVLGCLAVCSLQNNELSLTVTWNDYCKGRAKNALSGLVKREIMNSGLLKVCSTGEESAFIFVDCSVRDYLAARFLADMKWEKLKKHVVSFVKQQKNDWKCYSALSFLLDKVKKSRKVRIFDILIEEIVESKSRLLAEMYFSVILSSKECKALLSRFERKSNPKFLLIAASNAGNIVAVRKIISSGYSKVEWIKDAATSACSQGHVEVLDILLEHYSLSQTKLDLLEACFRSGHVDCAEVLINSYGAIISDLVHRSWDDFLDMTCNLATVQFFAKKQVVRFLLEKGVEDDRVESFLSFALAHKRLDVVKFLVCSDESKRRALEATQFAIRIDMEDDNLLNFLTQWCGVPIDMIEKVRNDVRKEIERHKPRRPNMQNLLVKP
jgi:hypothetical protein